MPSSLSFYWNEEIPLGPVGALTCARRWWEHSERCSNPDLYIWGTKCRWSRWFGACKQTSEPEACGNHSIKQRNFWNCCGKFLCIWVSYGAPVLWVFQVETEGLTLKGLGGVFIRDTWRFEGTPNNNWLIILLLILVFDIESVFSTTYCKEEVKIKSSVTTMIRYMWHVFESRSFMRALTFL